MNHPILSFIRTWVSAFVELLDVVTADAEEANRLRRVVEVKDQLIEELSISVVASTHSSGQMEQQLRVKDKIIQDFTEEMMTLQARIEELENAEEDQQLIEDLSEQLIEEGEEENEE